jgi:hypothetical protein
MLALEAVHPLDEGHAHLPAATCTDTRKLPGGKPCGDGVDTELGLHRV